jgi:hypothetical protein
MRPQKTHHKKRGLVKWLRVETLSSNPSTTKINKERKECKERKEKEKRNP